MATLTPAERSERMARVRGRKNASTELRLAKLFRKTGIKMARPTHYSHPIRRDLVRVLYHERIRLGIPMTRLVDQILTDALRSAESWRILEEVSTGTEPDTRPQ